MRQIQGANSFETMQNERDRGCNYFIWVDEEAILLVSQFNAHIVDQKKCFETELAKLML